MATPQLKLPATPATTVVARLEAALAQVAGAPAMLAFDADGTLWRGDVGEDVFSALIAEDGVREEAREALQAEAREAGVAAAGTPTEVASALFAAYTAGNYDEERAFAMMAWAFAGWRLDELEGWVERVLHAAEIDGRVHGALAPLMAWAEHAGVELWIVSASPSFAVRAGGHRLGVPAEHVLAMDPVIENGVVLPRLAAAPVYGAGKMTAIARARPDAVVLGAFGDSVYDVAMLRAARVPVAVDPKPSLVALIAAGTERGADGQPLSPLVMEP